MADFGNKVFPKDMSSSRDNTTTIVMAADLPKDMIRDILSRLPVKSLLRFKSVSKEWRGLISEPQFIKLQLNQSSQNNNDNNKRLVVFGYGSSCLWSIDCKLSYHSEHDKIGLTMLNLPIKAVMKNVPASVLCSCDGLVCLLAGVDNFLLWNPLTGDYRKLPTPPHGIGLRVATFGLGYDTFANDYKLVSLKSSIVYHLGVSPTLEISILTVKTNSWRVIGMFHYDISFFLMEGILVNGALHFAVEKEKTPADLRARLILSLDLAEEKITEVPQPDDYDKDGFYRLHSIGVLRGCLGMVRKHMLGDMRNGFPNDRIEIWVMKKYGVQCSWSKVETIYTDYDLCNTLTIKMIMMELVHNQEKATDSAEFLEYVKNKEKRVCNILGNLYGCASQTWKIATATYRESLVSPNGHYHNADANAIQGLEDEKENAREDNEKQLKEANQLGGHDFKLVHPRQTINYNSIGITSNIWKLVCRKILSSQNHLVFLNLNKNYRMLNVH